MKMKKRIIRHIGIFLFLFITGAFMSVKPCQAASAEVNIKSDTTEVNIGDNIFVYITVDSDTLFGDFEANLTYDEDILEYKGGASVITGGSGFLKITDMGVLDGDSSRKYTLKFEALEVGMCTIAFSGRAVVYDFATGMEMSVSSNELTLNVKAPVTASDNANLKSLKISPSELTPEFDPGIFDYNVTVTNETEQLVITALPEDDKASVTISGNDFLKEGENKVIVSVLAESGDVIKYNINVLRAATPTIVPTQAPEVSPETEGNSFELVTIDGEQFAIYSGRYKLLEPADDIEIPTGYMKGSMIISGVSITVFLPENNEESQFLLVYAMNDLGETDFYRYDRVEKTMLRYVPDSMLIRNITDTDPVKDSAETKDYNNNLKKAAVVIAILCAFSVILIFVIIRLILQKKNHKNNKLD